MFLGVEHGTGSFGGAFSNYINSFNFYLIAFLINKTISLKHSFALILGAFWSF